MYLIKWNDSTPGYLLKNGISYRKVSKERATIFDTYNEAYNYYMNTVKKVFRNKMEIVPYNRIFAKEIKSVKDKVSDVFVDLDYDWIGKFESESKFIDEIEERRRALSEMYTVIEGKICDVVHYIELMDFNDTKGAELAKLLKEYRITRRKIKDELLIISCVDKHWVKSNDIATLIKEIKGLDTRSYTPREIPELFDESPMV